MGTLISRQAAAASPTLGVVDKQIDVRPVGLDIHREDSWVGGLEHDPVIHSVKRKKN